MADALQTADALHPKAIEHLPIFVTPPGQTDVLMVVTAVFLMVCVIAFGVLYFRLHSLPEHIAHKSKKVQMELVAVLCLIALFTHMHIFWIAGLILAFIDLPDFGTPLRRIAGATEKIAGVEPPDDAAESADDAGHARREPAAEAKAAKPDDGVATLPKMPAVAATQKERSHA